MARLPLSIVVASSLVALGACTQHIYAPGPGMAVEALGPDSARCRLFARGTRSDMAFEAYGKPKDVAIATGAAMLVGGISTAIHDSETFDDCMQARGWRVVGAQATPMAVPPHAMAAAMPQQAMAPVVLANAGIVAPGTSPGDTLAAAPAPAASPPAIGNDKADRARSAAEAWLVAQHILDEPGPARRKHDLYAVLCHAGDESSCIMAQTLAQAAN